MKTTGIVSRLMAASSLLIGPLSESVSSPTLSEPSLGLSGDAWAMIGIGAILLTYRLVRKHQALYPMTVARPGLARACVNTSVAGSAPAGRRSAAVIEGAREAR